MKNMSNVVTGTFLAISATKPQRISVAWSKVVHLNKQILTIADL